MASLYGVSSGDLLMIALLVADLPNIQSVHQVTVYGMLAVCLIAIDFVVVYFFGYDCSRGSREDAAFGI